MTEMKIMVLDNYDSFTYNLVHIIKELTGEAVDVYRNDEILPEDVEKYDKILISPGPGIPDEAGITKQIISHYAATKSILGVCLGCQAIAEVFGGTLINLDAVFHGVETDIIVSEEVDRLFKNLPAHFKGERYHSWVVNDKDLPPCLRITAKDNTGMVMALAHSDFDVRGVQFHPESVLTEYGKQIILNWLNL
jgi:anthranilate synthase component II